MRWRRPASRSRESELTSEGLDAAARYTAAIVTFRRPESLAIVLRTLRAQSVLPSLTVVADNDPDESARSVVDTARAEWPGEILYAPVGKNLGPAGGWAHAVATATPMRALRGDWVLVIDDDDPFDSPDLVGCLLDQAAGHGTVLAGIGLRGARWDRARARLVRVEPTEGHDAPVDYLAGNGAPLYAWSAIDSVGFFNPQLFFGFEDLELGFRLASEGWHLRVAPHPSMQVVPDTGKTRSAWREYYKTRALVWTLRHHRGPYAQAVSLGRSTLLGGLRLAVIDRQPGLAKARLSGAWDGLRDRLGVRRYHPVANPPKGRVERARS